ncbi:hypothetical protein G9A89_003661 [Geosiphon pyriformis]|nr:hypothetical protein G9A89_003661 [Geosiphon pyriformis]
MKPRSGASFAFFLPPIRLIRRFMVDASYKMSPACGNTLDTLQVFNIAFRNFTQEHKIITNDFKLPKINKLVMNAENDELDPNIPNQEIGISGEASNRDQVSSKSRLPTWLIVFISALVTVIAISLIFFIVWLYALNLECPQTAPNDLLHEILLFMSLVAATLLFYRRILKEMRNHYNDEQSQRDRHLFIMLICSNEQIQHAAAIMGDIIAKNIVKNMCQVPLTQKNIVSSIRSPGSININWKYQHQIPGNSGKDSARSDFAAVIFKNLEQFPFFIAEFEANEFTIHKDKMVVVAETIFEYNKFLATATYMTETEVNRICLYVDLVNGTTI